MLKDNLIMLRGLHGLSQEQIAEKIGISRQAYAKWESGNTVPDILKCQRLAEVYGVTVDGLLKTETTADGGIVPPAPAGKHLYGTVTVSARGQIVIPKAAREQFGLEEGSRLILLGDENEGLAMIPAEAFEERLRQAILSSRLPADQ